MNSRVLLLFFGKGWELPLRAVLYRSCHLGVSFFEGELLVGRINYLCTYDLCSMIGPQMALAYQLDAISQGPKNSRIPGPNFLPLPLVMDMHASKTLCTGLYKS